MAGSLEALRVVDSTSGIAGAMAGMVLADHGAEVIKVEPPGGDPLRADPGSRVWHRGRRSVEIDLHDPAGREAMRRLVATADVLLESFPVGTMAEWGLAYDDLREELPALVYCSITGYPRGTDAADRPAIDLLVQARSGQSFEQPGFREGPIFLPRPLPSMTASFLALEGILSALVARETTGRGQWVETSLYQGVLGVTTQLRQDFEHRSESVFGLGMDVRPSIYECADGRWVHTMHNAGGRGKDRSAVWRILGIDQPENPNAADVLAAAFKRHPRDHILREFAANDLAIAPVRPASEALGDQLLVDDGWVVDVEDPELGPLRQVGHTFHVRGAPAPAVPPGRPMVGADTAAVLGALADAPRRAAVRRPGTSLAHALDGIKVLDLGNFLAGPFGPMRLGDLGATVYKLESIEGDQMRYVTMPFNGCQRGKLDISLDLKTPEGREIAQRLIAEVDVVHHNMRPGVAERLGVDYETAKSINPSVVYCHTGMWGLDGPRATWPGFDQLGQSSCGLEHELGGDGNGPAWYRFGMCDQGCAYQSSIAVLIALWWRARTGEGQFVDSSIVSSGMYYTSDQWLGPDGPGNDRVVDAAQTGFGPLYRLYECRDGWVALACPDDAHRRALAGTVPGLHTLLGGDDGATTTVLESWMSERTATEAFTELDRAGVPVEIADPKATTSWFDAPDLVARGLVADYVHAEYGRFRQFGHLVHLSETPGRIGGPPPLLGEHSREILTGLGYGDEAIDGLAHRRVTTWPGAPSPA